MARSRLTREEALAGLAAYEAKHGKRGTRKAYAALGDDTTLSRFVKTGEHRAPPKPPRQLTFNGMRNAAIEAGRSFFHGKGVKHPDALKRMLVSGHSNVKIGNDVRKGRLFRGYWIYTLSLEERATCPRTCRHWETCYGNNMPYAKRIEHGDEMLARLEAELATLTAQRVGILVRLHALGDFYSVEYVHFWQRMLAKHPNLAIFGYTARAPGTPIGDAIFYLHHAQPRRFAIRWSDGDRAWGATRSIRSEAEAPADAFICPEQTGKTACCATCGLCWNTSKNVAFLEH